MAENRGDASGSPNQRSAPSARPPRDAVGPAGGDQEEAIGRLRAGRSLRRQARRWLEAMER